MCVLEKTPHLSQPCRDHPVGLKAPPPCALLGRATPFFTKAHGLGFLILIVGKFSS